ncbi:stalk domain-containing protein [Paenibacillus sp. SC116]|uniref:stalk domain-containing protein n=1 Tax=Paenibacillus sp. SC116 TaxID=2968986 RepID=UPI00215ACF36|nr:stalk domain-containing protein [Paenibacillus sp. SC116]MCR8844298.1 stalk domain-containing protein [Paenibacillus sp. SC116]
MKRLLSLSVVALLLALCTAGIVSASSPASKPKIVSVIDSDTFLLDDGALWRKDFDGARRNQFNLVSIEETDMGGWGLTAGGKVVSWEYIGKSKELPYMKEVAQLSKYGYWLKKDGTVWNHDEEVAGLSNIRLLDARDGMLAALSHSGDIYTKQGSGRPELIANVPNAVSVHVNTYDTIVVDKEGTVTHYAPFQKEPLTVTTDAVNVQWYEPQQLLITKKDGTVWVSDRTNKFEMKQIHDLKDIVKMSSSDSDNRIYFQQKDGSWNVFSEEGIQKMKVPEMKSIKLIVTRPTPNVGDQFLIAVEEQYTNGYTHKRYPKNDELVIDQPQLIERIPDNKFKARAVGETGVKITANGLSSQAKISVSLDEPLQKAIQKDGVVYLPLKSVFQTIGGKVTSVPSTKEHHIQLGSKKIKLQSGSKIATVDGKAYTMKGVVQTAGGTTVFPAELLKHILQATISWDNQLKQAIIKFGSAKMIVQSDETAKVQKRAKQGDLAKYIGKSYWINHFQGWERFNKLTVTDIVPKDTFYTVVFKHANGKTLTSYPMSASEVTWLFSDQTQLLNYDPYKRYKWSKSIWEKIKKERVATGMTKEQVLMSWGKPKHTSYITSGNLTVESWGYGSGSSLSIITFTNGKVTGMYQ